MSEITKEYVINALRDYKRLIVLKNELEYKYDGVLNAQVLTDMPKGTGLSDPIQTALNKIAAEKKQLELDIKRINDWVNYLNEEESFVIKQIYFEQRFISHVINRWVNAGNEYHGSAYWKKKHRESLKKICEM